MNKYEVIATEVFTTWLSRLKDRQAVSAIAMRLTRAEAGNLGDIKSVGKNISEMQIFVGKGYRVYFTLREGRLIVLLYGGNKSSQSRDIHQAQEMLRNLEV